MWTEMRRGADQISRRNWYQLETTAIYVNDAHHEHEPFKDARPFKLPLISGPTELTNLMDKFHPGKVTISCKEAQVTRVK